MPTDNPLVGDRELLKLAYYSRQAFPCRAESVQ